MDILYHRDSKWGPGDFNLPAAQPEQAERSLPQPTPMFLEPTHYPQMRMPSTQFHWSSASLASHSINPAVLSTYTGYTSMESSPLVPTTPARSGYPPILGNPTVDYSMTTSSSSSFGYETPTGAPIQGTRDGLAQDHARATIEPNHPSESGDCKDYLRLPVPSYQISSYQAMSWNSCSIEGSSEALNTCRTLSLPRIWMPSSATRRESTEACADIGIGRQQNEQPGLLEQHSLAFASPSPLSVWSQVHSGEAEMESARKCGPGGPFIHAICGKGFASRYKVRKHHWGAKNDDIATTTGCWAKHGKPDCNWDDDESCKVQSGKARAAKMKDTTTTCGATDGSSLQAWAEGPKTVPGFPTLQDLPQAVAAALKTHGGDEYLHSGESRSYARHGAWGEYEDGLPCLDASLGVDAPKREARNDSVMSELA